MLNEAIVEGYIAKLSGRPSTWKWKRDTLFRLEVRRDPNRPAKPEAESRDEADFLTVRLPADRFAGLPFAPDSSKKIRVHGFLQSREYQETLGAFMSHANGLTSQVSLSDEAARQVTHNRVTTELVAERILQLDEDEPPTRPSASASRSKGRKSEKPAPPAPEKAVAAETEPEVIQARSRPVDDPPAAP